MSADLPQGVVLRHLETGDPRRDYLALGEVGTVPRIDPACLPATCFLAVPIVTGQGQPSGRYRVREFDREMAANHLSREPHVAQYRGIRLATDAEIEAHHQEAAARAGAMRANEERQAAEALRRHLAESRHKEATQAAIRAVFVPGKQPGPEGPSAPSESQADEG